MIGRDLLHCRQRDRVIGRSGIDDLDRHAMIVVLSTVSIVPWSRLTGDLYQHSHHHRLQCRDQAEVARSSLETDRVAAMVDLPLADLDPEMYRSVH